MLKNFEKVKFIKRLSSINGINEIDCLIRDPSESFEIKHDSSYYIKKLPELPSPIGCILAMKLDGLKDAAIGRYLGYTRERIRQFRVRGYSLLRNLNE